MSFDANHRYGDAGARWTDLVDGNGTVSAVGTVNANALGTYVLTYAFTDAAGNAATQATRTVTVVDTTGPVITCAADSSTEATSSSGAVVSYDAAI